MVAKPQTARLTYRLDATLSVGEDYSFIKPGAEVSVNFSEIPEPEQVKDFSDYAFGVVLAPVLDDIVASVQDRLRQVASGDYTTGSRK